MAFPVFCSLVCVQYNINTVYYTERKMKNKKRGRSGNEAINRSDHYYIRGFKEHDPEAHCESFS